MSDPEQGEARTGDQREGVAVIAALADAAEHDAPNALRPTTRRLRRNGRAIGSSGAYAAKSADRAGSGSGRTG